MPRDIRQGTELTATKSLFSATRETTKKPSDLDEEQLRKHQQLEKASQSNKNTAKNK